MNQQAETIFRIALAVLLVAISLVRRHYRRTSGGNGNKQALRTHRADFFLALGFSLLWLGSTILFIAMPDLLAWASTPLPMPLRLGGIAMGVAVVLLLIWVHVNLGSQFSSVLRVKDGHQLITTGPYRWVRHPMYSAFFLLAAAYYLISANALVGFSGLALMTMLAVVRIPREEKMLLAEFGEEYRQYMAETGRLAPRL
jgi:protein-S-isoprenylcysteine O-methyltransferase Ste14